MSRPKGSKDKKPQHKWTDEEKEYLNNQKTDNGSNSIFRLNKAKELVTTLLTEINDLLSDEKNHFDNTKELIAKLANRTW